MKQKERASIMRIASNLIKADGIIDTRETDFLDGLKEKYGITKEDEAYAEAIDLAKAFRVISAAAGSTKRSLMSDFNSVAMSDDFCAKEEALLLTALRLTLDASCEASVLSADSSAMSFENSQILYLENEYDNDMNERMNREYREIYAEARLCGFELVYLPKVSEHYSSITETDAFRIAEFLYPKAGEERIRDTVMQMKNLSTASFCNDQLAVKMSIGELQAINPSFLIKIGESVAGGKKKADFLLVEISGSPLDTIRFVMDLFAEYYHNLSLNYIKEAKGRFVFTGYYRQILDILMLRKGVRSPVVLDPLRERIFFPEADAELEKIHRREKALYALFLAESPRGGISFNQPGTSKQLGMYKKRMEAVALKYRMIYRMFGGEGNKAPDIEKPEIRMPMISLIKKRLSMLGEVLYNVEDYMIRRNIYGSYAVAIPPSLCCCCGVDKADIKPLSESEDWIRITML